MNDYKRHAQSSDMYENDSLHSLSALLESAEKICNDATERYQRKEQSAFISISDTIAIFSPSEKDKNDNYACLKMHAEISSQILNAAANSGFALRGAITFGEYAHLKSIIVGPGVDECASWYEQTDWIGVVFAPSAQFIIDDTRNTKLSKVDTDQKKEEYWSDDKIIQYDSIPVKNGFRGLKYCVDWGEEEAILNKTLENTISLSKEVAVKFINTNSFLYVIRPAQKK